MPWHLIVSQAKTRPWITEPMSKLPHHLFGPTQCLLSSFQSAASQTLLWLLLSGPSRSLDEVCLHNSDDSLPQVLFHYCLGHCLIFILLTHKNESPLWTRQAKWLRLECLLLWQPRSRHIRSNPLSKILNRLYGDSQGKVSPIVESKPHTLSDSIDLIDESNALFAKSSRPLFILR